MWTLTVRGKKDGQGKMEAHGGLGWDDYLALHIQPKYHLKSTSLTPNSRCTERCPKIQAPRKAT
jgi:hypothetical protein